MYICLGSVEFLRIFLFTSSPGYTDDVCKFIRGSIPNTMLADLKDSVKAKRSINVQDKYGATAVEFNVFVIVIIVIIVCCCFL